MTSANYSKSNGPVSVFQSMRNREGNSIANDPLSIFLQKNNLRRGQTPVPLTSTFIELTVKSGLLIVKTYRQFQNVEQCSIEAALTYPVPIDAVMFSLEAKVAGRNLIAEARKRDDARARYEDAVCDGQLAVLHEELLRGVHMLSAANLAPGAEVEVTTTWAAPLSMAAGQGKFRIPLTVGDIYGRSGLSDADDFLTGEASEIGRLRLVSSDVTLSVNDTELGDQAISIPLSRPIDITTSVWEPVPLCGRANDGRLACIQVGPAPDEYAALSLALLIDHSGSMDEVSHLGTDGPTKHDLAVDAVASLDQAIQPSDFVDLWEFDDEAAYVGTVGDCVSDERYPRSRASKKLSYLARKLSKPCGGTEIGVAIEAVIAGSPASDILLLTDGKSYALDVHTLSKSGKRISAILMGEDSLEANVGYLAALTGGSIFVASNRDISGCMTAAVRHMRSKACTAKGVAEKHRTIRKGTQIDVSWLPSGSEVLCEDPEPAAIAVATSLTMLKLDEEAAAQLAEQEGFVSHLTSLVLVDEESKVDGNLPKFRKVSLPRPMSTSSRPAAARNVRYSAMDQGLLLELAFDTKEFLEKSGGVWGAIRRVLKMIWHAIWVFRRL